MSGWRPNLLKQLPQGAEQLKALLEAYPPRRGSLTWEQLEEEDWFGEEGP